MDSLQTWRGTNQRTDGFLLSDGIFTQNFGIQFTDGSAARINGKRLLLRLGEELIGISQHDKIAILQTVNSLYFIPIDEL